MKLVFPSLHFAIKYLADILCIQVLCIISEKCLLKPGEIILNILIFSLGYISLLDACGQSVLKLLLLLFYFVEIFGYFLDFCLQTYSLLFDFCSLHESQYKFNNIPKPICYLCYVFNFPFRIFFDLTFKPLVLLIWYTLHAFDFQQKIRVRNNFLNVLIWLLLLQ